MSVFLQSNWFMWVVMIVVIGGIMYNIGKSAGESGLGFNGVWPFVRKVVVFILSMLFFPLLIIFGRTKARKDDN